jgi:DNA-binding beta-propeller fold protein YncE
MRVDQKALWAAGLAVLTAVLVWSATPSVVSAGAAQERGPVDSKPLPNPYQKVEGWAKLPAGRTWGAPAALDLDPDGKSIWVFERCGENSCAGSHLAPILKFDESGTLVTSFGADKFIFPHGLNVDKDGNVWVSDGQGADGRGHQVFKFSPQGQLLLTLGKAGVAGDGPDTFNMPSDVAVAPNGDIFVADGHAPLMTNMRIVKFSKDGKFIATWGKKGTGPGELDDPHSIAFDSAGRLFVADRRNNRIQIFDQQGRVLDTWKQFGRPSGLFISKDDTLYVADQEAGIRIGSARDGSVRAFIKAQPAANGTIRVAESVAVDAKGNVYGGENGSKKLIKYVPTR